MEGVPIFQRREFMKYAGEKIENYRTSYQNRMGSLRYFNDTKTSIRDVMSLISPPSPNWLGFESGGGIILDNENNTFSTSSDFIWNFNS